MKKIKWFKYFCGKDGIPTLVGFHGAEQVSRLKTDDKFKMIEYLASADQAFKVKGAETLYQPLPDSSEHQGPKIKGLISVGHSPNDPGAISPHDSKITEYKLNLAQALWIKDTLDPSLFEIDVLNPDHDDLAENGKKAEGYDFFIELHHNSYDAPKGKEFFEPGTEVFYPPNSSKDNIEFAEHISKEIAETLEIKNRGAKKGNLKVLRFAIQETQFAVLTESHFINDEIDMDSAIDKSRNAADSICKILMKWASEFKSVRHDTTKDTPENIEIFDEVRTFKRGQNIQISEHFHLSELQCKCGRCDEVKVYGKTIQLIENIRADICKRVGKDVPLYITSFYRCPSHNRAVGGAKFSMHLHGKAADLVSKHLSAKEVAELIERHNPDGHGVYAGFNHVDLGRGHRARW